MLQFVKIIQFYMLMTTLNSHQQPETFIYTL